MPSGQPLSTCQMLQEILGRYSFLDENENAKSRELLNAQEIFQLQQILVLNGNNKPLLVEPRAFFESAKLKRLTELPVHEIKNVIPLCEPAIMKF